jgi:hypothetical protein
MIKRKADHKYAWLPAPPLDINEPYKLGNYAQSDVSGAIAKKYLDRAANIKRSWTRICTHLPETVDTTERLKILDFSTAHGAMLEIWNALGHDAEGTDYAVPEGHGKKYRKISSDDQVFQSLHGNPVGKVQSGWIYQPIIESIGARVHLFDAGKVPYNFADKSFDYICCYQAIEAYAVPAEWDKIVDEFCRIARRGIVIGFNPPPLRADNSSGWEVTKIAWEKLRTYKKNGFKNVFFEFDENRRGFQPSCCKLVADNI